MHPKVQGRHLHLRPGRCGIVAPMRCRVVAIDVGSVRRNFAWAALDLPERHAIGAGGSDPEGAALAALDALSAGVPVALGFESPLMVPVSPIGIDGWLTLGQARNGESSGGQSRPWSAGAGSGALATGVVQMAWILERVGSVMPGLRCTTLPSAWLDGGAEVFVWEAFVSGPGKPVSAAISQHAADAAAAADTFAERLEDSRLTESDVMCDPAKSFNLAAAAALYAGLSVAPSEMREPLMVYRTQPAAGRSS